MDSQPRKPGTELICLPPAPGNGISLRREKDGPGKSVHHFNLSEQLVVLLLKALGLTGKVGVPFAIGVYILSPTYAFILQYNKQQHAEKRLDRCRDFATGTKGKHDLKILVACTDLYTDPTTPQVAEPASAAT